MHIRPYQTGDEAAQVEVYNQAARPLPGFKPAAAEEVARRYRAADFDPGSKLYGVKGGRVVGYILFNPNGRISYPWCLPGFESAREPLLSAALETMQRRGLKEAWAAYRADWEEPLAFVREHGFAVVREVVNYVAEVAALPQAAIPTGWEIGPLGKVDVGRLPGLNRGLFGGADACRLEGFFLENPWFAPAAGYVLKDRAGGRTLGLAVAIIDARFADPTKVDPAMPCFRLGALGTETERHKRVNGLFSAVFEAEAAGEALLVEAARRYREAGLVHAAAQAPSDQPQLVALYDRYFRRQGQFPILARQLS